VLAQVVEQGGERRELAADAGGSEFSLLQVLAPGDDVGPGDGAQLGDATKAGEGDELLDVELVGATGFGIGEIGEPFELGGNFGEVAELCRGQRTPEGRRGPVGDSNQGRLLLRHSLRPADLMNDNVSSLLRIIR
jgi:hypothetical protein